MGYSLDKVQRNQIHPSQPPGPSASQNYHIGTEWFELKGTFKIHPVMGWDISRDGVFLSVLLLGSGTGVWMHR